MSTARGRVGPICGMFRGSHTRVASLSDCLTSGMLRRYMCQMPSIYGECKQTLSPFTSQHTWPVAVTDQDREGWRRLVCPKRHVTHAFVACGATFLRCVAQPRECSECASEVALPTLLPVRM